MIAALRGERAPFTIGGAAARDFLHVSDVAEALEKPADLSASTRSAAEEA